MYFSKHAEMLFTLPVYTRFSWQNHSFRGYNIREISNVRRFVCINIYQAYCFQVEGSNGQGEHL